MQCLLSVHVRNTFFGISGINKNLGTISQGSTNTCEKVSACKTIIKCPYAGKMNTSLIICNTLIKNIRYECNMLIMFKFNGIFFYWFSVFCADLGVSKNFSVPSVPNFFNTLNADPGSLRASSVPLTVSSGFFL